MASLACPWACALPGLRRQTDEASGRAKGLAAGLWSRGGQPEALHSSCDEARTLANTFAYRFGAVRLTHGRVQLRGDTLDHFYAGFHAGRGVGEDGDEVRAPRRMYCAGAVDPPTAFFRVPAVFEVDRRALLRNAV